MRRFALVLAVGASQMAVPVAAQETWPDLMGKWAGKSRAIITSPAGHYGGSGTGSAPRFASADLVIEITQQDQGRYIGTLTSPGQTEDKLMVVAEDRRTLRTADSDGNSVGRILDADSFELCYTQINPSVASCAVFRRVK